MSLECPSCNSSDIRKVRDYPTIELMQREEGKVFYAKDFIDCVTCNKRTEIEYPKECYGQGL